MKCVVIYFSLTGNTEKIAKAIRKGVEQASGHCDIFTIKEANPKRLKEYDLIGLGSPVMSPYIPVNVENFIKEMVFVGGKHAFPFCTHNSLWYNFFPSIVPMLKKRGLVVIGWNDWFGSCFGPLGQPTPYLTDGHPDEIDQQEAEAFGREMVALSRKICSGDRCLIPENPPPGIPPKGDGYKSGLIPEDYHEEKAKEMKFVLKYDKEKCRYPKCGICMDICPLYGIDLTLDPPVIGKPCMNCEMCDQVCPTGAIEVDREHMESARIIDKETQFFEQAIDRCREYEEQGIFRRLIPEDQCDWDTLVYERYDKHPRFVIGKGRPYGIDPRRWGQKNKSDC